MKEENVLDVLLYLFENFFYDDPEATRNRDLLQSTLIDAGFNGAEIRKAFDWLDSLSRLRPDTSLAHSQRGPLRVYATDELVRLDAQCRGFLMFLEANGILDAAQRELVLERVLALELADVDLEELKWVVLMVLFNQPGQEAACAWMENHLFEFSGETVH
jgi:Smg protein